MTPSLAEAVLGVVPCGPVLRLGRLRRVFHADPFGLWAPKSLSSEAGVPIAPRGSRSGSGPHQSVFPTSLHSSPLWPGRPFLSRSEFRSVLLPVWLLVTMPQAFPLVKGFQEIPRLIPWSASKSPAWAKF